MEIIFSKMGMGGTVGTYLELYTNFKTTDYASGLFGNQMICPCFCICASMIESGTDPIISETNFPLLKKRVDGIDLI